MSVEREMIMNQSEVTILLQNYYIQPKEITFLRNEEKILARVEDTAGVTYYLKGEKGRREYIGKCCEYAEYLRKEDFPTVCYQKGKEDTYTNLYNSKIFTLEKALKGMEVQILTDDHLESIAQMLGKQHRLSIKSGIHINKATSWSLFGGNATDEIGDYDENEVSFWQMRENCQQVSLFPRIEELYIQRRVRLERVWATLPSGPVQGDFCYYNMVFSDSSLTGCYDYNLAGDELYINELVAVAIYHCWHVPYSGKKSEIERFWSFIHYYEHGRNLENAERDVIGDLFALIRAFRYDRIEEGLALQGEQRTRFLEETLEILESNIILPSI